jgi:hypothetical protein
MKIGVPHTLTREMADRATQIARADAVTRGWRTSSALTPVSGNGYFGVTSTLRYHMYQEKGTKPYLMTALEGKTIPMKTSSGVRFIKVRDVGQPGYVTLPGGVKIWRDQKWRHPGLKPTNMMQTAVDQTNKEYHREIFVLMQELMGLIEDRKYIL